MITIHINGHTVQCMSVQEARELLGLDKSKAKKEQELNPQIDWGEVVRQVRRLNPPFDWDAITKQVKREMNIPPSTTIFCGSQEIPSVTRSYVDIVDGVPQCIPA